MEDVTIAITDEVSARAWLEKVMLINDEYFDAVSDAAETLQEAKESGEGAIVDEFYLLGTELLNSSKKVYEAINEISSIVNTVIDRVGMFNENVTGAINAVKKLIG
jgi:Protein of unknown function DUF47.